MREIRFRGKRKSDGEWVYGYLVLHPGSAFILAAGYPIPNGDFYAAPKDWHQVDPATVGQWTGLYDSKHTKEFPRGRPVYEGDIVDCRRISNEEYTVWVIIEDIRNIPYALSGSNLLWREVIGNVHDNPELLQGGEAK